MKQLGLTMLLLFSGASMAVAKNIEAPPPLREIDVSQRKYFKEIYDNWNNLVVVTTSPDGSRRGDYGDIVFYNNSGTFKLCVQSTEGGGTVWLCSGAYSSP